MERAKRFWVLLRVDTDFRIMLLIATTLWVYSSLLKYPFIQPSNYSDVGYLWIRDVYLGHHNMQIPYVDYVLEYPPLIGALIWIGQAISTYAPIIIDQYNTYVVVESVLLYPFLIGTIHNVYVLCGRYRIDRKRVYLFMLTTLSFVVYGFYNWEMCVIYLVTLSIRFYLEKRFDASSIALSAGVLAKFIPAVMAPAMLVGLPNNRARLRFIAIAVLVWGAVNAPFAAMNFPVWVQLFVGGGGPDHQLQNTWISWPIVLTGLGDIVSGRRQGIALSFIIIGYLIIRSLVSRRTTVEKMLVSWYAWYGAIYLFDPQMFIELMPIAILTPDFNLALYRIADILNGFIILFYFIGGSHPELPSYLTNQLTPFGFINMSAAIRQLIFLGVYFVSFNPSLRRRIRHFVSSLGSPLHGTSIRPA
jgi:hypothetical protein